MNNEKINIQEIIDLVAAKTTYSKKQTEEFFRLLIPVIEDALLNGEPVKIKNFGTLKIHWNKPRKSVNVNTGEDIIISGYNKVVFTPDEGLKNLVNEPFAYLEPVELDGDVVEEQHESVPLKILNEQALEIKSILSEINNLNNQQTVEEVEIEEIEIEDKLSVTEIEVVENYESEISEISESTSDETLTNEQPEITEIQEQKIIIAEENTEESSVGTDQEIKTEEVKEDHPHHIAGSTELLKVKQLEYEELNEDEKKNNGITWWLVSISAIVVVFLMFLFINPNFKSAFVKEIKKITDTKKVSRVDILPIPQKEKVIVDTAKIKEDKIFNEILKETRDYDQLITFERMRTGRTLKYFAKKYYDNPIFWIYIYDANKDDITDPENIKNGTLIKIPEINSRLLDTTNKKTLEILEMISNELFNKTDNSQVETSTDSLNKVENKFYIKDEVILKNSSIDQTDVQDNNDSIEKTEKELQTKKEIKTVETNKIEQPKKTIKEQSLKNSNTNNNYLAIETFQVGSRLTLLALKYYGSKDFWVYIYEANKDVIKNPDNISVGTKIKIPKLDKNLIDPNNAKCIQKAKELQSKYLKK